MHIRLPCGSLLEAALRAAVALLEEALRDGTVDMIATDHAPHSAQEKAGGLPGSLNGIVGLECAFPVLYTRLVRGGIISMERLLELLCTAPAERFGLDSGKIEIGKPANLTVFDLAEEYEINSANFLSLGKATPFEGWRVYGRCLLTLADGKIAWQYGEVQHA